MCVLTTLARDSSRRHALAVRTPESTAGRDRCDLQENGESFLRGRLEIFGKNELPRLSAKGGKHAKQIDPGLISASFFLSVCTAGSLSPCRESSTTTRARRDEGETKSVKEAACQAKRNRRKKQIVDCCIRVTSKHCGDDHRCLFRSPSRPIHLGLFGRNKNKPNRERLGILDVKEKFESRRRRPTRRLSSPHYVCLAGLFSREESIQKEGGPPSTTWYISLS